MGTVLRLGAGVVGWNGALRMGAETLKYSDLSSNPLSLQQHKPQPLHL